MPLFTAKCDDSVRIVGNPSLTLGLFQGCP
jgi:hypothetical protein